MASFIQSAFTQFSNRELLALLQRLGLKTKVERGGRVFPASDRALDVLRSLEKYLTENRVRGHPGEVTKVLVDSGWSRRPV